MPLTLQFGPWAPDLKDVPVQVPDNQGPMQIPCADCLNVYYANGKYRNIPSPALAYLNGIPVEALLNDTPLNAYSYFDNVEQQQSVFVGTPVGVQQIPPGGGWEKLAFLTSPSAALIGQAMSWTAGNFANTDRLRGQRFAFTAGAMNGAISATTIVAAAYYGGGGGDKGGGAGFTHTGFSSVNPAFGSAPHPGLLNGTLTELADYQNPDNSLSILSISLPTDPTQTAFTTIKANGKIFTSSSATYSYDALAQTATWEWPTLFGFAGGATYAVTLT
jgi:hypothetical protein